MYEALNQAQLVASQQTRTRFDQLINDVKQRQPRSSIDPKNSKVNFELCSLSKDNFQLVFTDTTEFCRLFSSESLDVKKPPSDDEEMPDEGDCHEIIANKRVAQKYQKNQKVKLENGVI